MITSNLLYESEGWPFSVHRIFIKMAQRFPDQVAVQTLDRIISYAELNQESNKLSNAIKDLNLSQDIPIIIAPSLDYISLIISVIGILKAGHFFVYLSDSFPKKNQYKILEQSQSQLMIINEQNKLQTKQLLKNSIKRIDLLCLEHVKENVQDNYCEKKMKSNCYLSVQFNSDKSDQLIGTIIDHLSFLIAWRDSNISHKNKIAVCVNINVLGVFVPLMKGATLFLYTSDINIPDFFSWFIKNNITNITPPIKFFRKMAKNMPHKNYLPSLRIVMLNAKAITFNDIESFSSSFPETCSLSIFYSTIETHIITKIRITNRYKLKRNTIPVGFPLKKNEILILDESGNLEVPGKPGNIAVKSSCLSPGYWKRSKLTQRKFLSAPDDKSGRKIFLTGDMGLLSQNGRLELIKKRTLFECGELFDSVHRRFMITSRQHPNALAVQTLDNKITYKELNLESNKLANAIINLNISSKIPIILSPDLDLISLIISTIGILKAGSFYIYLSQSYPKSRVLEILKISEPELIIINDHNESEFKILIDSIEEKKIKVLSVEHVRKNGHANYRLKRIKSGNTLSIQFTSGTTGSPKAIEINHLRYLNNYRHSFIAPDQRVAVLTNFNISGIIVPLMKGATVYPYNPATTSLSDLISFLKTNKITIIAPPVSLFRKMTDAIQNKNDLPYLRNVLLYGQTILPSDIEKFREKFSNNSRLFIVYSTTETFGITRVQITKDYIFKKGIVPVGFPVKNKEVLILDNSGNPEPQGKIGEIAVRSHFLSQGYWKNPQLTKEKFIPDPQGSKKRIFLTGDLGLLRPDRCLELVGRKDRQIKIRGYRVELEAIEAVISSLEDIKEVAAKLIENKQKEKEIAAYIVEKTKGRLTFQSLRNQLSKKIPSYMIPRWFVFMDKLPTLINFKTNYHELPEVSFDRNRLRSTFVYPQNATESTILKIWEEVLQIKGLSVTDDFFELGGDSIHAVTIISEIEKQLGHQFSVQMISNITTVEQMANNIINLRQLTDPKLKKPTAILKHDIFDKLAYVVNNSKLQTIDSDYLTSVFNNDGTRRSLFWCFNDLPTEPLALMKHLPNDQPLYCLYSGINMIKPFASFVEKIAKHYVHEIQTIQPHGPYYLGGNCGGANIMVHVAHELIQRNERISKLCIMEYFNNKLFDYSCQMLLLYGKNSHLHAYKKFNWHKSGWEKRFKSIPLVEWLPGKHGEFFDNKNIPVLGKLLTNFFCEGA